MRFMFPLFLFLSSSLFSQKHIYNVELFGNKIGTTTIEKIDTGGGEVRYKLKSSTEVSILFSRKTSKMDFEVVYKNGKLFSSYCKNVKDDVTEVTTIAWNGTKYLIKKGLENLELATQLDFSSVKLYFIEPKGKTKIFSERLGAFCDFTKTAEGEYTCKLDNGVSNIYRYRNGVLYELEMSKGASVYMRLVK